LAQVFILKLLSCCVVPRASKRKMSFSKVMEYFYVSASTITQDRQIYALLGNGDCMKAFEHAEEALENFEQSGSEAEVAAALVTCAAVSLACDDADEALNHAERALTMSKKAGNVQVEAAAMNIIAKIWISLSPAECRYANEAMTVANASGNDYARACAHHTLALAIVACGGSEKTALVVANDMVALFAGSGARLVDAVGEGCAMLCVSELQTLFLDREAAGITAKNAAAVLAQAGDVLKQAIAVKYAASAALSSTDSASEGFYLAEQALSLFAGVAEIHAQVSLKLDMANAKLRAEEYVEAEDLVEEALATCKEIGDLAQEAESTQVLATVRLAIAVEDAKDKDEADTMSATEASRDALALFRKLGNKRGEAVATHKLAQVRYYSGASDMAKLAAEEAQEMFKELGDVSGEAGAVLLIAHVMHKDEQFEGARRAASKALTLYQNMNDNEGVNSCTDFLEKIKTTQTTKTREAKAANPGVSDTGLVKLVNSTAEATHLLTFLAEMNDDEDTELCEFDLSQWGNDLPQLKIKA